MKTPMTWSVAPFFIVDDVVITANFYRDKLGFHYERFWGDPPRFCMVQRSGIVIMLGQLILRVQRVPTAWLIPMAKRGTLTFGSTMQTHCVPNSRRTA